MPKYYADSTYAESVTRYFATRGMNHLRARKYGQLVIIESGPEDDPIPHARLRRDTVHLWQLEMATHTGRWEKTGFRDLMDNLLELMTTQLAWTFAPRE
jgi:hypothetical protein